MKHEEWDVVVVGGGITGLTATMMFQKLSLKTLCIEPNPPPKTIESARVDLRSTAYLLKSIDLFKTAGLWNKIKSHGQELKVMTIKDRDSVTGKLRNSSSFFASDLKLPYLAYNIPNWVVKNLISSSISEMQKKSVRYGTYVVGLTTQLESSIIKLSDNSRISAKLVVGADGRNSTLRALASIKIKKWGNDQAALAFLATHTKPHNGESIEILSQGGPCTSVPMKPTPDGAFCSACVWMEHRKKAHELMLLDDVNFSRELSLRMSKILGDFRVHSKRSLFSVTSQVAERFFCQRLALIGEAAHVMPPIGAQGLNTSLEDIQTLYTLLKQAIEHQQDIGSQKILKQFDKIRRASVKARMLGVNLLNHTSKTNIQFVNDFRNMSLKLLSNNLDLRKLLMRVGLGQRLF